MVVLGRTYVFLLAGVLAAASASAYFYIDLGKTLPNIASDIIHKVTTLLDPPPIHLPEITLPKGNSKEQNPPLAKGLFGTLPVAEKELVETQLNLYLKGTFPSSSEHQGTAIITVDDDNEKLVHIGEEVLRGVTLRQVFEDHVILDRANIREILRFAEDGNNTATSGLFVSSIQAKNPTDSGSPTAAKNAIQGVRKPSVVDKRLLKQYEQSFKENPASVLNAIGLAETEQAYEITDDSVLSQAGLQSGDKIVSINGQPIKALLSNSYAITSVISTGSARISVMRGQKRLSIRYRFE